MGQQKRNRRQVLTTWLLIGMLLAAGCPPVVWGQGSEEKARGGHFLEERIQNPYLVLRRASVQMTNRADPAGLHRWTIEGVDSAAVYHSSMALDAAGRPHIAYSRRDPESYDLDVRYVWNNGDAWVAEVVDESIGTTGGYISLALDTAGHPHICYYDAADRTLKYAWSDGVDWQFQIVDSGDFTFEHASLVLDSAGLPRVSYYRTVMSHQSELRYARSDGSSWDVVVVDTIVDAAADTALALDSNGRPRIAYYGSPNSALKYAAYDGATWQITLLAGLAVQQAGSLSLALSPGNLPRIAYYDGYHQSLMYTYYTGSQWKFETVDSGNYFLPGLYLSMAMDAQDRPHIAYYDGYNRDLWYVRNNGSLWARELVDSDGGTYVSVGLDQYDRPRLAYATSGGLRYAVPVFGLADWARLTFNSLRPWNREWNWEIYAAAGDGGALVRLTSTTKDEVSPELNRGGNLIAFSSNRAGSYEIYRMNSDGSGIIRLTWTGADNDTPTWSPDGGKIAFVSYRDGNAEIYVMNADGSSQTRLTWDPAWDGYPTWSPDGSRIAFVSNRSGAYELWVMNADGSEQRQLSYGLHYAAFPDWSPDGGRIALNDDGNGDGWFDLAVINADGTGLVYLRYSEGSGLYPKEYWAPVWAPHGSDLAFSKVTWTYYDPYWLWTEALLYGLDLDRNITYLLATSGLDWFPDWQPTETVAPTSQVAPLPVWSGIPFYVRWTGDDGAGIGLRSYDVEYRDGLGGTWTTWLWDTPQTSVAFTGEDGHTYYFRCRARDYAFNVEPYPADYEVFTTVDVTPPTSAASSPEYAPAPTFVVSWGGSDATSGIVSYDVQYRDGAGPWTDWLLGTTDTSAAFVGELGHTYYFQSRARDRAGNLEAYPGGDGDTHTHTPAYTLDGYVLDNRDRPVAVARVEASPPMSNTAYSRADGAFTLYYSAAGFYALDVTRSGFGLCMGMPPAVMPGAPMPYFYLPPLDNRVKNGDFEGNFVGECPDYWTCAGDLPPVVTTTTHTGKGAVALGGAALAPVVTPTVPFTATTVMTVAGGLLTSALAVVEVPAGAISGTVLFTLTGVPTVTALPTGTQDIGLHIRLIAALTDGTPLTATLLPLSVTLRYSDAAWQDAQVSGEDTLRLWRYDAFSLTWWPLDTALDPISNTAMVTTTAPGLFALLGRPYTGPWSAVLEQEVVLTPTLQSGTLSLLYRVQAAQAASDTLWLYLTSPMATVTYTLPLTVSGWVHRWWDLSAWAGPTLTLRLEWLQRERDHLPAVVVDEISLGPAVVGAYPIYLPLVLK